MLREMRPGPVARGGTVWRGSSPTRPVREGLQGRGSTSLTVRLVADRRSPRSLRPLQSVYRTLPPLPKETTTTHLTTGLPSTTSGWYRRCFTALSAASASSGFSIDHARLRNRAIFLQRDIQHHIAPDVL